MDQKDRLAIASMFVSAIAIFMAGRYSVPDPPAQLFAPPISVAAPRKPVKQQPTVDEETLEFIKRWQAAAEKDRIPVVTVGELADAGSPEPAPVPAPKPVVVMPAPIVRPTAVVVAPAPSAAAPVVSAAPVSSAKPEVKPDVIILEETPVAPTPAPQKVSSSNTPGF